MLFVRFFMRRLKILWHALCAAFKLLPLMLLLLQPTKTILPGIYIHIPFCRQACSYCDFYFSTSLANKGAVVSAIIEETRLRHAYLSDRHLNSIYFGGGTPSLLSQSELGAIMEQLGRFFSWNSSAEVTLEANPDDITPQALQSWKAAGINRLSIGLQSFNDDELKWMNRAHNAAESVASVKMAQDAGFDNITIDLIYGSKFQTPASWEKTLEQAIALNTQHISSYNLTIEDKTVLGVKNAAGKEPSVNDELSSRQFMVMLHMLRQAGFIQYEISNFGREGYFAVHNSNYWLQKEYLGLGPSAHSYNGVSRQWNVKNNSQYIKAINSNSAYFEKEELQLNDRYNEYILTRLRTTWGCDIKEMESLFGKVMSDRFETMILEKKEFIFESQGIYTLNDAGKLQADGIAADLFV